MPLFDTFDLENFLYYFLYYYYTYTTHIVIAYLDRKIHVKTR